MGTSNHSWVGWINALATVEYPLLYSVLTSAAIFLGTWLYFGDPYSQPKVEPHIVILKVRVVKPQEDRLIQPEPIIPKHWTHNNYEHLPIW